ncbi:hypothetical protein AQUCO_02000165v1 [Aquilegia coerulea]|uniref:CRC domain-containing protein n=1 Tax=Aquilegia coerulea TaxID=218851 RepID=A0A2G5DG74_AQUCA|nr:hypothetical protein AQUCO_02000165v1 [Aquilegia coerulea]
MDSPETNKIVTSTSTSSSTTSSPVVQESPFFNYLRTLSPIKPVKAAHVAQGFPELSIPTPPPVFTSPRLNPQSETIFLNRSKHFHSSNKKLSIGHEGNRDRGTDISERPISRLTVRLVSCSQKGRDSKCSAQVQPSSPSQFVDEFLADPVEVVRTNSSDPDVTCLNHVDDTPEVQLGCIRSKETTVKENNVNDELLKYVENGSDVQIKSSEQTEVDLQGRSVAVFKTGKMENGESQSVVYQDLASEDVNDINFPNSCIKPVSGAQNSPHGKARSAEGSQEATCDNNNQVLSEIMQMGEYAGVASNESAETKIVDPEETGQNQRVLRRRCLQFEASVAHRKSIFSNQGFSSPAIISRCSRLPANSTEMEMLESSELDCGISNNICTANSSQPMASKPSPCAAKTVETHNDKLNRSVRNGGNPSIKAPLPSGIGLHLNSIVNTAAMGCTASLSRKPSENDYPSAQREKPPSVPNQYLPTESKSFSVPASVLGKFSVKRLGYELETQSIADNSATFQFPNDNADQIQEFNQLSPQKKRKRTFTNEDEGCKRCNCRRSKCLKLYCECFAAGIYCAEPCACQECFNKPQYEDKVLETRKQIESRNPLAFAPKIVRRVTDSPANSIEENKKVTPASARHKRGCNCKKSMCLKKYCECYQSGVGCSAGCRCEGCKNAFGIKEGYGEVSERLSRKVDGESWEDNSDGKLAMVTRSNFIEQEHCHPHNNLTPLTPSLQYPNQGKDVHTSRLPGRRFLPSPESETNHLSLYAKSPGSTRYVFTHERRSKMGDGNLDIVFDQEVEFSTTGRIDQFSPRWDGFEDICDLTPLPQTSSKAKAILSPSNSRDSGKVSQIQLQGSVRLSGSLRWRSSPITPTPQLGESKLRQEPDSDVGCAILEDDTPDILKDTHTPIKTVKASSPNQKRVSPPHNHLHNLRSSPSPGLKSGRKFVLQSISSFPPLTPYSDPKDCSSKK